MRAAKVAINSAIIILIGKGMKSSLMRPPAVTDIYNQKTTYENHLRKLTQIRQERKTQLQLDHSRNLQMQQIKNSKSKTFANKFNDKNLEINQSNVKFLVKLQKVRPFVRHTSQSATQRSFREPTSLRAPVKQRIIQTEKENNRIFFRMKSVSSTLGRERMASDYNKAQQIKDRITRFSKQDNRVTLKSQKFISPNRSAVSNRSLSLSRDSTTKKSLAQHYKKEDILKNRIANTARLAGQKRQNRALPSLPSKAIDGPEDHYQPVQDRQLEKPSFFATEPAKRNRSQSQTRRFK